MKSFLKIRFKRDFSGKYWKDAIPYSAVVLGLCVLEQELGLTPVFPESSTDEFEGVTEMYRGATFARKISENAEQACPDFTSQTLRPGRSWERTGKRAAAVCAEFKCQTLSLSL